jgi:hypothetical protein
MTGKKTHVALSAFRMTCAGAVFGVLCGYVVVLKG